MTKSLVVLIGLSAILAAPVVPAVARLIRPNTPAGPGGMVNLPYGIPDQQGNQWMIYQNGWLQQQGNQQIYSQGAMLTINGNQPNMPRNQARVDEKTGEVILENLVLNGLTVTRRILVNKDDSSVRYVDVIKNTTAQAQNVNVMLQTNLNFGVNAAQMVADPKKKDQNMAWVAQTGAGRCVVEMFSGPGSKTAPTITWQNGNNVVQSNLQVAIPPGKEIALVHLHVLVNTMDQGVKFANAVKPSKLLATIPSALRKLIVNFTGGQNFVGDYEILRGDMLDVAELRGGDLVKGTLKETSYKLQTFYGPVELSPDRVIGLINVGKFRPRQLLVTTDGEIFGGKLEKQTIDLQLSSGQVTQIPLAQINRLGYRKRADEKEEWTFDKPLVLMRSGDRIGVKMPDHPVEIHTRYGELKLPPQTIASIFFQSPDSGVHQIYLTDGSHFSGLVAADQFEMELSGGSNQKVKIPASSVSRVQLAAKADDIDDSTSTLDLMNDDMLIGSLIGQLKLDTAFDTITLNAAEVKQLTRPPEGGLDVQVTLWDQSTVSGQLQESDVQCQLVSGATIKVPVALIEEYSQPRPKPSSVMVDRIKAIAADLNADDWKQRDRAQSQLISMGPAVIGVLKEMRNQQPPEAQQRIDQIFAALSESKASAPAPTPQPMPAVEE